MKKRYLTVGVALALAFSITSTSCLGSFALTNSLLDWNRQVGSKVVNELVFFAFWVLPVYEVSALADALVLNSIEFWSGTNPMTASTQRIEGANGNYLVKCDATGYTITDELTGAVTRIDHDADTDSWVLNVDGQEPMTIMTWVDGNHVSLPAGRNGEMITVQTDRNGLMAYRDAVAATQLAVNNAR